MYKSVRITPHAQGGMEVIVDGVNVSRFVSHTGISVEIVNGVAYVTLPVAPAMFVGAFPQAIVNALTGPDGPVSRETLAYWAKIIRHDAGERDGLGGGAAEVLAALDEILGTDADRPGE